MFSAEEYGYSLFTVTDHFQNMLRPEGSTNHPLEAWTLLGGLEGFMESRVSFMDAFALFKSTIEDIIAEGNKVAVRLTHSCIHRGELMGLAPTNKQVTYTETTIWRIVNSKIVERWCNSDTLSLFQQLGAITIKTA